MMSSGPGTCIVNDTMVAGASSGSEEGPLPDTKTNEAAAVNYSQEDKLSQLPKELIQRICQHVCSDGDKVIVNRTLLALRLCNKMLATASDLCRLVIILHSAYLVEAAPLMSKLVGLVAITVSTNPDLDFSSTEYLDFEDFTPPATVHRIASSSIMQLSSLCKAVKSLASFTLQSRTTIYVDVQELLPWQHSLKHLALHRCTLISPIDFKTNNITTLKSWAPIMPHLDSLVMTHGNLVALELSGCPRLCDFNITNNTNLSSLTMASCNSLSNISCHSNHMLTSLDLSGCNKLGKLGITAGLCLTSLVLTGCTALQNFNCLGGAFKSLCMTDCTSLDFLSMSMNRFLQVLDLTPCSQLSTLYCSGNASLSVLKLPHGQILRCIDAVSNDSLLTLDVSACGALKSLILAMNRSLQTLDCSGLQALRDVHCSSNQVITRVKTNNCVNLRRIHCQDNISLVDIDLSGCKNLIALICTNNRTLKIVNAFECASLLHVTCSGCEELKEVDFHRVL